MTTTGFISHIGEEAAVASYVKSSLAALFPASLEVFVSSTDMDPGVWLSAIREVIGRSGLVFPLLSVTSMERPWVNFETGCAFMCPDAKIIPLCHKDLRPADLKAP